MLVICLTEVVASAPPGFCEQCINMAATCMERGKCNPERRFCQACPLDIRCSVCPCPENECAQDYHEECAPCEECVACAECPPCERCKPCPPCKEKECPACPMGSLKSSRKNRAPTLAECVKYTNITCPSFLSPKECECFNQTLYIAPSKPNCSLVTLELASYGAKLDKCEERAKGKFNFLLILYTARLSFPCYN